LLKSYSTSFKRDNSRL